jgi:hypothetical protein
MHRDAVRVREVVAGDVTGSAAVTWSETFALFTTLPLGTATSSSRKAIWFGDASLTSAL